MTSHYSIIINYSIHLNVHYVTVEKINWVNYLQKVMLELELQIARLQVDFGIVGAGVSGLATTKPHRFWHRGSCLYLKPVRF